MTAKRQQIVKNNQLKPPLSPKIRAYNQSNPGILEVSSIQWIAKRVLRKLRSRLKAKTRRKRSNANRFRSNSNRSSTAAKWAARMVSDQEKGTMARIVNQHDELNQRDGKKIFLRSEIKGEVANLEGFQWPPQPKSGMEIILSILIRTFGRNRTKS